MMRGILMLALVGCLVLAYGKDVAEQVDKNEIVPEEKGEIELTQTKVTGRRRRHYYSVHVFSDGRRRYGSYGHHNYCPSGMSIIPVNAQYTQCSGNCGNATTVPAATYTACIQQCTLTRQNNVLINSNNCRNLCCTSSACCAAIVDDSEESSTCSCDRSN